MVQFDRLAHAPSACRPDLIRNTLDWRPELDELELILLRHACDWSASLAERQAS